MPTKACITFALIAVMFGSGCADDHEGAADFVGLGPAERDRQAPARTQPKAADTGVSTPYTSWEETGRLTGQTGGVKGLVFLPNSSHLIAASFDGVLIVVDVRTLRVVNSTKAHHGMLTTFAVSPDGKYLASGDAEKNVKIWDTLTWECREARRADCIPYSITFSPDSSTLATSGEKVVELWDLRLQTRPRRIELGIWPIAGLVFSHSGDVLFVAGVDNIDDRASSGERGTLRAYDVDSLELFGATRTEQQPSMWSLALSADGAKLAMACGLYVNVYNWTRASEGISFDHRYTFSRPHKSNDGSFEAQFYACTFDPRGKWLAFCAASPGPRFPMVGHVEIVDSASGTPMATLTPTRDQRDNIEVGSQSLKCIAFSKTEGVLAAGGNDGTVTLWKQSSRLVDSATTAYQPPALVGTYWTQDHPNLPIANNETFSARRFRLLYDRFRRNERRCFTEARAARDAGEERALLKDLYPPLEHYVPRLIDIAQSNAGDDACLDALVFGVYLLSKPGRPGHNLTSERLTLLDMLRKNHADDPELSRVCYLLERTTWDGVTEFLRFLLENSASREVRAHACISLGNLYGHRADEKQAVELYERVNRDFADVESRPRTFFRLRLLENPTIVGWIPRPLGEIAEGSIFAIRNLQIGKAAPDIAGTDIDGQAFKLSDYRGKVVVLAFSGNWCGPCRAMYPQYRNMVNKFKDKPFALLHVNSDSSREEVRRRKQDGDICWRSWWDGGSSNGPIAAKWNVSAWPTIYVIDDTGVIRYKSVSGTALDGAVDDLVSLAPE